MAVNFLDGVKQDTSAIAVEANGATYISWAAAVSLAGRPEMRVMMSGGSPVIPIFGGGMVAVAQAAAHGIEQVTYLPVLDAQNKPIPFDRITSRDASDTVNRCRAKSAAMVQGVGLSLYAKYEGKALAFLKDLGVKPDSDLAKVEPLTETKKGGSAPTYVSWAAALAAARITDPDFFWQVMSYDIVNQETGELGMQPYAVAPIGYLVGVRVIYKGHQHTEMLPIMGVQEVETSKGKKRMDHQPLPNPTVFDWNRAVMRCLTKAIAVASGYGISIYAKEDIDDLQPREKPAAKAADAASAQAPAETPAATAQAAAATAAEDDKESSAAPGPEDVAQQPVQDANAAQMILEIENALAEKNRKVSDLTRWLGHPTVATLAELPADALQRAYQAMKKKAA